MAYVREKQYYVARAEAPGHAAQTYLIEVLPGYSKFKYMEHAKMPDEIATKAVDEGYEIRYCSLAYGVGRSAQESELLHETVQHKYLDKHPELKNRWDVQVDFSHFLVKYRETDAP